MNKTGLALVFAVISVIILGALVFTCNPINNYCYSSPKVSENVIKKHLSPSEFDQAIKSGEYKLIDMRTIDEYEKGHIKGSSQIDFYETQKFFSYLDTLDKNGKYLLYCGSGNRSGQALNTMEQEGFKNVSDLAGGIRAWEAERYPIAK